MSELLGIVRFKFHEGKVEEYKRLATEALEIVRAKDTGTLQYDVYLNADETEAIAIERFTDSDALIQHGANMAELSKAILETGTVDGELLGEPSEELRAKLTDGEPPQLFTPYLLMGDR